MRGERETSGNEDVRSINDVLGRDNFAGGGGGGCDVRGCGSIIVSGPDGTFAPEYLPPQVRIREVGHGSVWDCQKVFSKSHGPIGRR